jgi:alkylhydroperoxidase/carboxymuconolactone decarboxylase family protein YurZ
MADRVESHERTLRRLTIRDDAYVDFLLADQDGNIAASSLDGKTHSLVRLAALIADDATPPSYLEAVDRARHYGVSDDEIVGTLLAVLPSVGVTRVVAAAPRLGLALGYDVVAGLESRDP